MTLFHWSRIAASNGTADVTAAFPEGMGAPALNDGARGIMAAVAKYRDDIAGAIVTTGSATSYAVSSFQGFDSLAHLDGQMIVFTPHTTNGANGTGLNVDGLGIKPVLPAPGVGLPSAVLIQGTPYAVTYNNTDGAFYLHGIFGGPWSIPLSAGMDYWGPTAPNSAFAFPIGQAISRTTYAGLFALLGTIWGAGDGTTTFNLPDLRGRVTAAVDNMGGVSAGRFTPSLGAAIGEQNHTLLVSEVPALSFSGTTGDDTPDHTHNTGASPGANGVTYAPSAGAFSGASAAASIQSGGANARHHHPFSGSTNGGGGAHNVTQPTIVCNYIMRIL